MFGLKKVGTAAAILTVLVLATSAAQGEDALLRLKFNEGDIYTYKIENATVQEQMGMEITQKQTQWMQQTVKAVDGDTATIEVKIVRVKVKSNNPMSGDMEYDSESGEEVANPQLAFYGFMVDKKFTMKMTTRGEVTEVKGFTKIGQAMIEKIEEMMGDNPQAGMIRTMMGKMLTDDFMKKTMGQSNTKFPEGPVSAGSTWKEESVMTMPIFGDLATKLQNEVVNVDGDMVKVKFKGTMESQQNDDDGDEGMEEDPMAAMLKMMKISGGKITGDFEYDVAKGLMKKRVMSTKMTVEMMGNEMPMTQTTTTELVKIGAYDGGKKDTPDKGEGDF